VSTTLHYIRSNRVLIEGALQPATLEISDGKISRVITEDLARDPQPLVDYGSALIFPGLIDVHVHVNEPGRTQWEGFDTATRAAAAGGVTTIADMPLNSSPVTISPAALAEKRATADGKLWVHCAFHGGVVHGSARNVPLLVNEGVTAIKAFMVHSGIDDFPESHEPDLLQAMQLLAPTGVPLMVHAELPQGTPSPITSSRRHSDWLDSRPTEMETEAIAMLGHLAQKTGAHVHVVHVSSRQGVDAIRRLKNRHIRITAETCPHYLSFSNDDVRDGATEYKCAPPIREAEHRDALWRGLQEGVLDLVASDHSPSPPDLKQTHSGDFFAAWGGIASLQFLLPATWTGARERGVALEQLAQWLSTRPAHLLGLDDTKGYIDNGYDADLTIWDPEAEFVVTEDIILHRHKLTPYIARQLYGRVIATYVDGQLVHSDGTIHGAPAGRKIRREGLL